jgi:hypothetical protein
VPKSKNTVIAPAFLRECFDCDFEAGTLTWRHRLREHFATANAWKTWNTMWAGKTAGSPDNDGYLCIGLRVDGKQFYLKAHRVIWALAHDRWPENEIDHRNGARNDNRLSNLREATHSEQMQNLRINNTSGISSVSWASGRGKWQTKLNGVFIGRFDDLDEARRAALVAKEILHPFQPVPRNAAPLKIHSAQRMAIAHQIVRNARRRSDERLEIRAWEHFIDAM